MSSVLPAADLLAVLRAHALLDPEQLDELQRWHGAGSQALAQRALERGWLTPFQVNRILTGRVKELLFGQYLLQAKLGEGGMGQVFRALDRTMHRVVAVKLIRPEVLDNPGNVERFLKEIRAVASLRHPNIVLAYHAGQVGSTHFLVMEYVEGKDLGRLVIEKHPLPVASVCEWGRQAALALQHVGEKGLVHRDVKPSNLLLASGGDVKLLDLGLVRVRTLRDAAGDSGSTRHGTMMGTPDYLAPEQIADAAGVDIRADVYSLGCTLYHLLAGRPPFPGEDLSAKIRSHLTEEAQPVERLRPDLPAGLGEVVRRMMRKDRADRYQSPREVVDALAGFAAPGRSPVAESLLSPVSVPPSLPPTGSAIVTPSGSLLTAPTVAEQKPAHGRKLWLPVALVLGLIVAGMLWRFLPERGGDPKPEEEPEEPKQVKGPDRPDDRERPRDKVQPRDKENLREKPAPVLLPPREPPPFKDRLPWQPAELVQVLGDERGRHWAGAEAVVWSGDGKRLVSSGSDGIRVWDAATLRERFWLKEGLRAVAMALSPDGQRLAVANDYDSVQLWDLSGAEVKKSRFLRAPERERPAVVTQVAFADDGKAVLAVTTFGRVLHWQLRRETEECTELVPPRKEQVRVFTLSPSATKLAWGVHKIDGSSYHIRDVGLKPGPERRVGDDLVEVQSLVVSPDGRWLATAAGGSIRDGRNRGIVRTWGVDEPPAEKSKHPLESGGAGPLAISRDGKRLAAGLARGVHVWDVKDGVLVGDGKRHDITAAAFALAFDPTGTALAVAGYDGMIRILDLDRPVHEEPTRSHPPRQLAFSADGRRLAAVHTLSDRMETAGDQHALVRVWDLDRPETSRRKEIAGFVSGVTFTPDGKQLAIAGGTYKADQRFGVRRGFVRVFDLTLEKTIKEFDYPEPVHKVQFHSAAELVSVLRRINYSNYDPHHLLRQYDAATWKERGEGKIPGNFVSLDDTGRQAVSREDHTEPGVGRTDRAVLWDLSKLEADGARRAENLTVGKHPGAFVPVFQEFFPDGKRLATVHDTGNVVLWDVTSRQRLAGTEDVIRERVSALVVSQAGSLLAAVLTGNRVAVWDASPGGTLKKLREPWVFPGAIHALAFDPTGTFLATATADGVVYLLRVR